MANKDLEIEQEEKENDQPSNENNLELDIWNRAQKHYWKYL